MASTGRAGAEICCQRDGPVTVVRLNRPAARNALSSRLVGELAAALAALDEDPGVRAVVLTGAPPGFCAGSDLKELAAAPASARVRHEARAGQAIRAIQWLSIPVVAAVEGFALGGGFLLAAGCDIIVTASNASWQLPEVRLGWVPPWGLHALIARAGPAAAKRLAWGDQPLTGRELHRLGAADQLAEPGQALPQALEYAARLAELPPHSVASTKRAMADAMAGPAEALDARTTWMFGEDSASTVAQASLANFGRKAAKETR